MKENTNNKIYICWNCYGPLTGTQMMFCDNDLCENAWHTKQAKRDLGYMKVWVYLNKAMVELAKGEHIEPHALSGFISTGHDLMAVAQYDYDALQSISDAERNTYDAYWREVSFKNHVSLEPHNPVEMRKEGMLAYLSDHFGLNTETKIAGAIIELTALEGAHDAREFFNSL